MQTLAQRPSDDDRGAHATRCHAGRSSGRFPVPRVLVGTGDNRSPCRREPSLDESAADRARRSPGESGRRLQRGLSSRGRSPQRWLKRAECLSSRPPRAVWCRFSLDRSDSRPFGAPFWCRNGGGVDRGPRPVDLTGPGKFSKQQNMQRVPEPRLLPVAKPTPTRHSRSAAHLLRQVLPWNPGSKNEDDPRQRLPVTHARPATFRARRLLGKQRRDQRPQLVWDQRLWHA